VTVRVYRPKASASAPRPGVFEIHGGGFMMGDIAMMDPWCQRVAAEIDAVVVSVEYRLAPEHPFPAGVEDCYAALVWTATEAKQLGIDPERIAVAGQSAGGGLAAATALLARDRGAAPLCFQLLEIPELDDRLDTPFDARIHRHAAVEPPNAVWSWKHYLGPDHSGEVRPTRRPRAPRTSPGLPPPTSRRWSSIRCATRASSTAAPAPGRRLGGAALVPGHVPRLGAAADGRACRAQHGRGVRRARDGGLRVRSRRTSALRLRDPLARAREARRERGVARELRAQLCGRAEALVLLHEQVVADAQEIDARRERAQRGDLGGADRLEPFIWRSSVTSSASGSAARSARSRAPTPRPASARPSRARVRARAGSREPNVSPHSSMKSSRCASETVP
jgi:hypothetical protein